MSIRIYENKVFSLGYYQKPHGVVDLAEHGLMDKADYILFDLLLHFENRYTKEPNSWFFCSDVDLCKTRLISQKTLKPAKEELEALGLIEYEKGHSHKATKYRIMIPAKRYYKNSVPRKIT